MAPDASRTPGRPPLARESRLSRLGLGTWAFGRTGWGAQDDRDSHGAILRAVELGVTWIDTAAVYGDGHSERLVGGALRELSDSERPLIFTKGGVRIDASTGATFRDLSPDALRVECEQSLQRLGVERIDLYQLHWPVEDTAVVEVAWETLAELIAEGKVRWAGASNFDIDLLERCTARHHVDAAQLPLSLLSRDAGTNLLPWLAAHGSLGLIYSPLESGLLSGAFSQRRLESLDPGDRRPLRPQFQGQRLAAALDLAQRLRPIASGLGASLAQLAIAWTLTWPGVSGTIVGARDAAQVDGWAHASSLDLDAAALDEIALALHESHAGTGPTRSPEVDESPASASLADPSPSAQPAPTRRSDRG